MHPQIRGVHPSRGPLSTVAFGLPLNDRCTGHRMLVDLPMVLSSLWQPAHFYLGRGLRCAWQFEAEQILPWELFRGRLLDSRQTRETRTFLTWNLLPVENGAVG